MVVMRRSLSRLSVRHTHVHSPGYAWVPSFAGQRASERCSHDLHRGLTLTQLALAFDPPRSEVRQRRLITICSFDKWGN